MSFHLVSMDEPKTNPDDSETLMSERDMQVAKAKLVSSALARDFDH